MKSIFEESGPPIELRVRVNGSERTLRLPPLTRLLDALREELALTGTKEGCGEGECGACSVILDGEVVNSCLVAVGQCDGRTVTTVEGLASRGGELHPVQRALVECGGAQCGICTPGIAVCAAHVIDGGLVAKALDAGDEAAARMRVRELLAGNICRCTGYQLIVDAIVAAAREVARG